MKRLLILLLVLLPSLGWATDIGPDIDVLPGTTVEVGEEVFFSASDTTYAPNATYLSKARYEWDFGDGYTLNYGTATWASTNPITRQGVTATHYFMSPGEKTVTLSVKIFSGHNFSGDPWAFASTYPYGTTLGMGSDNEKVANGQFKYTISGTLYTLDANWTGTTPGDDVVPKNKYGAVALDVGTDKVIHVIEAADNATGYTSWATAVAGIPAVAADHVRIGTVAVCGIRKAFTFGTTQFDDPDISFSITPSSAQLVGTSHFTFAVGETIYTLPENLAGYPLGDDVIPDGKYGCVALDVGTDLAVDTVEATDNATGYASKALAEAGLPAVAENHVRMGFVTVLAKGQAFTYGKDSINSAANTNVIAYFTCAESTPIDSTTTTSTITVTGTQPLDDFEVQRAPLNNRTKQYLYVQVPTAYQGNTTQLKISVIDTTADPDVTTVLYTKTSDLDAEEIYLFDHTTLTAGHDYVLQTQLLDAAGDQIADGSKGGIWRDKFTAPASTPTVTINENNTFVIGGNFVFPIAPFMINASQFASYITQMGINSANTEGYYATHTPTTFGQFLTSAASSGIYVMGPGRGDYELFATPNRFKYNHDPDAIEAYVTANKTASALFAWVWQDEPNLGGRAQKIYPPVLAAWKYIASYNDPNHVAFEGYYGADWGAYLGELPRDYDYLGSDAWMGGKKWMHDVISFDIYPITYFRKHPCLDRPDMGMIAAYLDNVDRFIRLNKDLVPFIPAINPSDRNVGLTPAHTEDEVFVENWLNVIHGAKGIFVFAYFDPTSIRWAAMKKFSDQMAALKHIALLGNSSKTITDDSNSPLNRVDFIARDYGSETWIFAARVTEPDPIVGVKYQGTEPTYTGVPPDYVTIFTMPDLKATDTITVYGENRTISHGAGYFSDQFAKHAVHIYQITTDAPPEDTTAPTVDAFEIPSTYESTTVPITTFLCSDAVGVTKYLVNEVASEPAGDDAGWSETKQTTYTFGSVGAKTLYAWCKDAAGNISTSKSDTTTLTTPAYDVSLSIGAGCIVSPSSTQSVPSGDTASFTVSAVGNYAVASVTGCGGTWGESPYETGAITEDCTVTFSCVVDESYTVTPSVGTGCYITPSDAQTVINGSRIKFNLGALYGYTLLSYGGCGGTLEGYEYTTGDINSDCTVSAVCGGQQAIISTAGGQGTITFGTGGGAPSGCNELSDKVGNTATDAASPSIAKDVVNCQLHTPSCYGTLKKAYVAHVGTLSSSAKVCVYSDDGNSTVGSGDLKIGCSGDITSTSTEWASDNMDGGTLVSGNYWVCVAVKSDATNAFAIDTTTTTYETGYKTSSGFYASPPDNLGALSMGPDSRGFSMYVTMGN